MHAKMIAQASNKGLELNDEVAESANKHDAKALDNSTSVQYEVYKHTHTLKKRHTNDTHTHAPHLYVQLNA